MVMTISLGGHSSTTGKIHHDLYTVDTHYGGQIAREKGKNTQSIHNLKRWS